MTTTTTTTHTSCTIRDNCEEPDCPAVAARTKRDLAGSDRWWWLDLRHDGAGPRHYVDDVPIHCGDAIILQAVEERDDDYGSFRVPLETGVRVRYEASFALGRVIVTLHTTLGGHAVTLPLRDDMRFMPVRS